MVLAIKKFDQHTGQYINNPNIAGEIQVELAHNSMLEIFFPEGGISECKVDGFTDRDDLINNHPEGHVLIVASGLRAFYGSKEQEARLKLIFPDPKDLAAYGSLIVGDTREAPGGGQQLVKKEYILIVDHETGKNGGYLSDELIRNMTADSHGRVDHDYAVERFGTTSHGVQYRMTLPNFSYGEIDHPMVAKGTFLSQKMSDLPWENLPEGVSPSDIKVVPLSSIKGMTDRAGHDLLLQIEILNPITDSTAIAAAVDTWFTKNLKSGNFSEAKKESPVALIAAQETFRTEALAIAETGDLKALAQLIKTEFPPQKVKIEPGLFNENTWIGVKDLSADGKMATASLLPVFSGLTKDIGVEVNQELERVADLRSSTILLAQDFVEQAKRKQIVLDDADTEDTPARVDAVALVMESALNTQNYALLEIPSVVDALKRHDANQFRNIVNLKSQSLAFDRGMLVSSGDLKAGEICIPGYPEGEVVIGFRSPLLNSNGLFTAVNRYVPEMYDADGNERVGIIITNRETAEEISYGSADKAILRTCEAYGVDLDTFMTEIGADFAAFRKELKEAIEIESASEAEAIEQSQAVINSIVDKFTDPQLKIVSSGELLKATNQNLIIDASADRDLREAGEQFFRGAESIGQGDSSAWEQGIETSANAYLDGQLAPGALATEADRISFANQSIDKILLAMDLQIEPERRAELQIAILATDLSPVEIRAAISGNFELQPAELDRWIGDVAIDDRLKAIGAALQANQRDLPQNLALAAQEQMLGAMVGELTLAIGIDNWAVSYAENAVLAAGTELNSKLSLQMGDGGWQTDLQRMAADHDGDCIGVAKAADYPNLKIEVDQKLSVGNRHEDADKAAKQFFPHLWTIEDVAVYNTTNKVGIISNLSTAFQSIETEIDILLEHGTPEQIEIFAKQIASNFSKQQKETEYRAPMVVPEKVAPAINPAIEAILGSKISNAETLVVYKQILRVLISDIGYANQLGVDQPKSYVAELMGSALEDIDENRRLLVHGVSSSERKDSTTYQQRPISASSFTPQDLLVGKVNSQWAQLELEPVSMQKMKHVFGPNESTDREKDIAAVFETQYNSLRGTATQYRDKERDESGAILRVDIQVNGNIEQLEIANIEAYLNPQLLEALDLRRDLTKAIRVVDVQIGGIGGDDLILALRESDRLDREMRKINSQISLIEGADGLTDHDSLKSATELRTQLSQQIIEIGELLQELEGNDPTSESVGRYPADQQELTELLVKRQTLVADLEQIAPLAMAITPNQYTTASGMDKKHSQTYHQLIVQIKDENGELKRVGVVSELDRKRLGLVLESESLDISASNLKIAGSVDISNAKFAELNTYVEKFKASLVDLNITPEAMQAALWHNNLANFGATAREVNDKGSDVGNRMGILFNVFPEQLIARLEQVNMATYTVAVPKKSGIALSQLPALDSNVNFKILEQPIDPITGLNGGGNNLLAIENAAGEFVPVAFVKNESYPAQVGTSGVGKIEASLISTADIKIDGVDNLLRITYPYKYDIADMSSDQISDPTNVYRIDLREKDQSVKLDIGNNFFGELSAKSIEEYNRIKDLLPTAKSVQAITSGIGYSTRTRLTIELEDGNNAYLTVVNELKMTDGELLGLQTFGKLESIPIGSLKFAESFEKEAKAFLQMKPNDGDWLDVGFISKRAGADNPDGTPNKSGNKELIPSLQATNVGIYPQQLGVGKEFSGELLAGYSQFQFVADRTTLEVDYSLSNGNEAVNRITPQSEMFDRITTSAKIIGQLEENWRLDNGKIETIPTLRIAIDQSQLLEEQAALKAANVPFLLVPANDASVSKESQRGYRVIKVLERDMPEAMRKELSLVGADSVDSSVAKYNISGARKDDLAILLATKEITYETIERDGKQVIRIDRACLKGQDESTLLSSLGVAVSEDAYKKAVSLNPKQDLRTINIDTLALKSSETNYKLPDGFDPANSPVTNVGYPKGTIASFTKAVTKDFGCNAQIYTYGEDKLLQFEFTSSKQAEAFNDRFNLPITFEQSGKWMVGVEMSQAAKLVSKSLSQVGDIPAIPNQKISLERGGDPVVVEIMAELAEYSLDGDVKVDTFNLLSVNTQLRDRITGAGGLNFLDNLESARPDLVDALKTAYMIIERPPILMMDGDKLFTIAVPTERLDSYTELLAKTDPNLQVKDLAELTSVSYTQIALGRASDATMAKLAETGLIVESNVSLGLSIAAIGSGDELAQKHRESVVGIEISPTSLSKLGRLLTTQTHVVAQNSAQQQVYHRETPLDFRDNAARTVVGTPMESYGSQKAAGVPFASAADAFQVYAKKRSLELGPSEFATQFPLERMDLMSEILIARFEQEKDFTSFNAIKTSGGIDFLEKCSYAVDRTLFTGSSATEPYWWDGQGLESPMIQALCNAYEHVLAQKQGLVTESQVVDPPAVAVEQSVSIAIGVLKAKNQDPTYQYVVEVNGQVFTGEGVTNGKSPQAAMEGLNAALAIINDISPPCKISVEINSAEFVKGINSVSKPKSLGADNLQLYQELSNRLIDDIEISYSAGALDRAKSAIATPQIDLANPSAIPVNVQSIEQPIENVSTIPAPVAVEDPVITVADEPTVNILAAATVVEDPAIALDVATVAAATPAVVEELPLSPISAVMAEDIAAAATVEELLVSPVTAEVPDLTTLEPPSSLKVANEVKSSSLPAPVTVEVPDLTTLEPPSSLKVANEAKLSSLPASIPAEVSNPTIEQPLKIVDLSDRLFIYSQRKDANKQFQPLPDVENLAIVRIDRISNLGNPFFLRNEKDTVERDLVVKACGEWLDEVLAGEDSIEAAERIADEYGLKITDSWKRPSNQEIEDALSKLTALVIERPVAMSCWCAPEPCHGDVLKSVIENRLSLTPGLLPDSLEQVAVEEQLQIEGDFFDSEESLIPSDQNEVVEYEILAEEIPLNKISSEQWNEFKQLDEKVKLMNEQQRRVDIVAPIAAGYLNMYDLTEHNGKDFSMDYNPKTAILRIIDNQTEQPIAIARAEITDGAVKYQSMNLPEGNPGLSDFAVKQFVDLEHRIEQTAAKQKATIESRTLTEPVKGMTR